MNNKGKKTLRNLLIAVPLMFAFAFALVPLYNVFCEVTGINGKVFQSEENDKLVITNGRDLSLQFISTNNEMMPWVFKPSEEVMKIKTGQYYTASFYVKNPTDKPMIAQAVPSLPVLLLRIYSILFKLLFLGKKTWHLKKQQTLGLI